MKEKQKNEIKVGLTVLIGLIILLTGFYLVKEWSVSGSDYPLTIRFETSAGLQRGDIVTVNGVKSGKVESINVDGNTVLVRAMLNNAISLTSDADASIQMLELMSGKKIEIKQGLSKEKFDRNKILIGRVDPDIAGALAIVGQVKGDIVPLSSNANQLLVNLNKLLGDPDLQSSVKETFSNLNKTMIELREMVAENRANTKRITENLSRLTSELDTIASQSKPQLKKTFDNANSALAQTDTLFLEVRSLLHDVRSGNGMLHQALYDSTFTSKIDTIMIRINQVLDVLLDKGMKVRVRL